MKDKQSSTRKIAGGSKKKRITPTIAQGRLREDIRMTSKEIEYHSDIYRMYKQMLDVSGMYKQIRIVEMRKKHLKKLKGEIEE